MMQGIKTADEDTDWCDIMGHDPYWVPARREKSQIDYVSWLTRRMRQLGDEERKPIWMILIAERIAASYKRYVNAREQRCQIYLALIAGARELFIITGRSGFKPIGRNFCRLAREIKELSLRCWAQKRRKTLWLKTRRMQIAAAICRRHCSAIRDGRYVLLCANYHNYPLEVAWQIAGPEIPVRVSEYSAGMPYFVKDEAGSMTGWSHGYPGIPADFPKKPLCNPRGHNRPSG